MERSIINRGELGPVNYQVKSLTGNRKQYTVHVERLKKYNVRDGDLCELNKFGMPVTDEIIQKDNEVMADTVERYEAVEISPRGTVEPNEETVQDGRPRRQRKQPIRLIDAM